MPVGGDPCLLELAKSETAAIQTTFAKKRATMLDGLRKLGVSIDVEPEGTFYAWGSVAELPDGLSDGPSFFRAALDHKVIVVPPDTPDAKPARTHFQVKATHGGLMLLELRPQSGRKHQLRVQLAIRGCPVFGDVKYGASRPFGHAVGLHARSITFLHPTKNEPITLTAEVPKGWRGPFAYLLK